MKVHRKPITERFDSQNWQAHSLIGKICKNGFDPYYDRIPLECNLSPIGTVYFSFKKYNQRNLKNERLSCPDWKYIRSEEANKQMRAHLSMSAKIDDALLENLIAKRIQLGD